MATPPFVKTHSSSIHTSHFTTWFRYVVIESHEHSSYPLWPELTQCTGYVSLLQFVNGGYVSLLQLQVTRTELNYSLISRGFIKLLILSLQLGITKVKPNFHLEKRQVNEIRLLAIMPSCHFKKIM